LWYRKAAESGDPTAQYNLGIMYVTGTEVAQNSAEGRKWIRKAADQGQPNALAYLAAQAR
jgi:uncharacterized protein